MREIIFDTETTGLDANEDRIIELGGVELFNRFPTGRSLHLLINPAGRAIHPDALAVHGIGMEQLQGKPFFAEIVDEFLAFIDGAKLVAHNATFDMTFVNAELQRLGHPEIETSRVVDTLALAKRKHPMGPNSLDALCRRYGIDNSRRTKHGALLDSELLAEVYIELIGGKQASLVLEASPAQALGGGPILHTEAISLQRPAPLPPRLSDAEIEAHDRLIAGLGEKALWAKLVTQAPAGG